MSNHTYHCPNCNSSHILVRENANEFYELDYADPESGDYGLGKKRTGDFTLIDMDLVCNECLHVFPVEDLVVNTVEEEQDDHQYEDFVSKEEAAAFCMGIEFVNDSSITINGPYEIEEGKWRVYIEDQDA